MNLAKTRVQKMKKFFAHSFENTIQAVFQMLSSLSYRISLTLYLEAIIKYYLKTSCLFLLKSQCRSTVQFGRDKHERDREPHRGSGLAEPRNFSEQLRH